MKIDILYGKNAVVLPMSVISKLDRATKRDLKILFALSASPEKRAELDRYLPSLAADAGCTETELLASISFWRGAGIIETDDSDAPAEDMAIVEEKKAEPVSAPTEKKPETPDELPRYTTAELNRILESQQEASLLIDEAQRVIGKIFNPHEIGVLLGLRDYLGLDSDYILILLDYCARNGKKSLQYIKKRAFSLYDEGITDPVVLHEHLLRLEASASLEGEIRRLFGMKDRALTTKEKKFIAKWIGEYAYPIEVIQKAYEMTVDAIHEPSPAYANAIIERWFAAGLRDLAAIEAADAEKLPTEGSFDTNDFFESALRRSFGDN